jgi:hypothetical protein
MAIAGGVGGGGPTKGAEPLLLLVAGSIVLWVAKDREQAPAWVSLVAFAVVIGTTIVLWLPVFR